MNAGSLLSRRTYSICLSCRHSLLQQLSSNPSRPRARFASSFQAYPLPPQPQSQPQPRNASVPDTSIAHPVEVPLPRVHDTRPPRDAPHPAPVSASVPEGAAQKSTHEFAAPQQQQQQQHPPTAAPSTSSASSPSSSSSSLSAEAKPTPAAPRRPSKLRAPRKAAVRLTPAAVARVRALLDGPAPQLLRVGVRNRGCSGLAYHLEYVAAAGPFDEVVEQEGVRVLVDSKALFSILGSEMDWVEDKLSQRFVFRNPNIKEQCGCGESFMV